MRVFLDDSRPTPEGWVRVYAAAQTIELLESGEVKVISLDYDLGDPARATGLDVLTWMEEAVRERGFKPPEIRIHSAARLQRIKMQMMADAIMQSGSKVSAAS